ncbi:MAG: aromatic ring-hydroxylating dioxygenase subunit alpha [Chromatiales bacterium]|jgi:phenylpropionate dioxygenase-like ring-hydroxylating dioxygenase large terminal subunit|nr:aromatic ring-hydroxylating dioxygenase subunit alpha [Chromatiales bacterium]
MSNRVDHPSDADSVRDLWHVIAAVDELVPLRIERTQLLDEPLRYRLGESGHAVWLADDVDATPLPVRTAYGYLWTCLGQPREDLFAIPEYEEADRRNLNAATLGVHVSAPRAIENFLDLGHFPFVHTDILGVEPHTEVKDYQVDVTPHELMATQCRFFQPMAAAASSVGADVDYVYRVPHPYCSVLYKSSGADPKRMDVIALFIQPVGQERSRANMLLSLVDDQHSASELRDFQLTIFGQDKPILENQLPKRLPLSTDAEVPIRADKASIAYRRWLRERNVRYGVIPAANNQ